MKIYKTDKKVLSLKKDGIGDFLNGLTSNEMNAINNAFLNIHGRIIVTFEQVQISSGEYLILVEKSFVDAILDHINRYIKLGGVVLEHRTDFVYHDLDGGLAIEEDDQVIDLKNGRLVISKRQIESSITEDEYLLYRVNHHLPVQGVDFTDEMLLNVSTTDYVSFTKGCFLGQEPISKVYNRSKPTWRLVAKSADDCSEEEKNKMTSKVYDPGRGQIIGFVFEKNQ